jgi:hypothetical protein
MSANGDRRQECHQRPDGGCRIGQQKFLAWYLLNTQSCDTDAGRIADNYPRAETFVLTRFVEVELQSGNFVMM